MKHLSPHQRLGLEDLLGDLWYARRSGDLGRLALLSYYEVRRWARMAGEVGVAEHSSMLVTECPHPDRESFLAQVDSLILELEQVLDGEGAQVSGASAIADELMDFDRRKKWKAELLDASQECAAQVRKDAATYNAAWDDGAFDEQVAGASPRRQRT